MRRVIELPRRSLPTTLTLGAAVGAVFLGVGGRLAMRIIALLEDRGTTWSFEGSLTVVVMGAVFGTIGGLLLWLGRRVFPRSPFARGALFWVPLTALFLRGLSPLSENKLISFLPFYIGYGLVVYRLFCHRYVARWATPAIVPA
jgi:hypothetical protein